MPVERDVAAAAEALARLGAATVGESGGRPLSHRLRPIWAGPGLAGPALPVVCVPGDNLAVHVAVANAAPGSVLAVSVGDLAARGYWGEVLTVAAASAGLAGLVIDGCVRDVVTFEAHHFPVFARGVALRGTSKDRGGTVGAPAIVGGVIVSRGDWLVGDADGVVHIESSRLEAVLDAARARQQKELRYFDELRHGKTTLELLSLDPSAVAAAPEG